jgi:hypothetical protein
MHFVMVAECWLKRLITALFNKTLIFLFKFSKFLSTYKLNGSTTAFRWNEGLQKKSSWPNDTSDGT